MYVTVKESRKVKRERLRIYNEAKAQAERSGAAKRIGQYESVGKAPRDRTPEWLTEYKERILQLDFRTTQPAT